MSAEKLRIFSETERPIISVSSLLRDNRSEWADEVRRIWHATKAEGNLTFVEDCGDARTVLPNPDTVANMNYIAVGEAAPEPQKNILNSPGVNKAVVIGHFDGETLKIGKMPTGCGGLAAKQNQLEHPELVSNLDYYIRNNIYHPDPIIQALITARGMFEHTAKPILAAAQDHRTGKIYPIGLMTTYQDKRGSAFNQGGLFARKSVLVSMDERRYDPARIYETGLPALEDHEVPQYGEFLYDANEKVERLKDKFPNHYEDSKVHDPILVVYSTSIIPFSTRFPEIGEKPGIAFGVFVTRKRIGEDEIEIQPEEIVTSSSQIEYPIMLSLENHGQEGKPFASTNTVLIDTESFSVSYELARKLVAESNVVRQWVAIAGHKIIISKTSDGVITQIEEFKPNI